MVTVATTGDRFVDLTNPTSFESGPPYAFSIALAPMHQ